MTVRIQSSLRTLLHSLLLAAVPALLCATLTADELRLDDGRVLVGKVVAKNLDGVDIYEVHTRDGIVVVPVEKVTDHFKDDDLRQRLTDSKGNSGSTAFAYLQLAIDAHSYGLEPEMWRLLDTAMKKQADQQTASQALKRRLRDFLARLEPEILPRKYRSANTETRVRKLLVQVKIANKPSRTAAIEELLVREPNADATLRREARRNALEYRRIAALQALARRADGEQAQTRFVLRTTIFDGSSDVREAAARIVRDHGHADENAVAYLTPGLMHQNHKVRVRTAEAFAELGHPAGIDALVAAGPSAGTALVPAGGDAGHGTRAHVAFLNQQAYIRDFDVEVAQAAFIADPKIDVLQSGSVLDVRVAGVFEERVVVRAYRSAVKRLAKADPGRDPGKWASWHGELQAKRAAAASTPARQNGK